MNSVVANGLIGRNNQKLGLKFATLTGYVCVVFTIALAWSLRDQQLIRAEQGLGYWFGIIGSTMMLLLLVYPLRKRIRRLHKLGSVRFWFRTHMMFGIMGPLLVLLHSNFSLGSPNGRVALYCTLVVASSGLIGRYLYAKIHHGMYGQRATLESLQADPAGVSTSLMRSFCFTELINNQLAPYEQLVMQRSRKMFPSILAALTAPLISMRLRRVLGNQIYREINIKADQSNLFADQRDWLILSANEHLDSRLSSYRKFAQLSGCERLFGLWHVIHFPLFMVMVLAAVVHVIAVHAY